LSSHIEEFWKMAVQIIPNFVTVDRIYLIEFEIIDTTDTYIALLLEIDNTGRLKENVMVLAS
jgi:hypothetical protein